MCSNSRRTFVCGLIWEIQQRPHLPSKVLKLVPFTYYLSQLYLYVFCKSIHLSATFLTCPSHYILIFRTWTSVELKFKTNLMHNFYLFNNNIISWSSTCFEHHMLIFRRTLYICSIWYPHALCAAIHCTD
jgi:hypothetical protein